jgi:tetratricopeptide (TPR) repeat protein
VKTKKYLWEIILLFFAVGLYVNTIVNDYNLDDEFVTNGNPQIAQGISAIPSIFTSFYQERQGFTYGYRPVVKSTFAIEYELWGWNPHASHAINVFLFGILAVVLFRSLKKIFKKRNKYFPILITLIFIVHPVHTEVVCSLKNRDELLCAIGGFSSLLFFMNSITEKKVINILLGVFFFLFALLSKLSALPLVVLIPITMFFMSEDKKKEFFEARIDSSILLHDIKLWISVALLSIYAILKIWIVRGQNNPGVIFLYVILSIAIALPLLRYYKQLLQKKIGINQYFFWIPIFIVLISISGTLIIRNEFWKHILYVFGLLLIYLFSYSILQWTNAKLAEKLKQQWKYIRFILLLVFIAAVYGAFASLFPSAKTGNSQEYQLMFWQNPLYFNNYIADRILCSGATFWFYFVVMIFPFHLSFYYGYDMIPFGADRPEVWAGFMLLIFFTIYGLWSFFKKKSVLSFGVLFFIISFLMYANIFAPVPGIVAERLVFIASLGFCIVVAFGILYLSGIRKKSQIETSKNKLLLVLLSLIIIIPFSIKTVTRNAQWKTHMTLFSADISKLERSVKANDLMAAALYREVMKDINKGKKDSSIKSRLDQVSHYYGQCVKVYPAHYKAWNNMGLIKVNFFRDFKGAVEDFSRAVMYDTSFIEGYSNLGYSLYMSGDMKASINAYLHAVKLAPDSITILSSLANVYFNAGDTANAQIVNLRIIKTDPESPVPYMNMASNALALKDTMKALQNFDQVLRFDKLNKKVNGFLWSYYMKHGQQEKAARYRVN